MMSLRPSSAERSGSALLAVAVLVFASVFGTVQSAGAQTRGSTPFVVSIAEPLSGATVSGQVGMRGTTSELARSAQFNVRRADGTGDTATVAATQTPEDPNTWVASWNSTTSLNAVYSITFSATRTSDSASATSIEAAVTLANGGGGGVARDFSVTTTSPDDGATLTGQASFGATTSGTAESLSFVLTPVTGGSSIAVSATGDGRTWSATWASTEASNGSYVLVARAVHGGVTTEGPTRTVIVSNVAAAPRLSAAIVAPESGAAMSGTATFVGTTNVVAASVTFTVLDAAGVSIATVTASGATGLEWTGTWDTTSVPNGDYAVRIAASKSGESVESGPRPFVVSNVVAAPPPMVVTVRAPASGASVSGTVALSADTSVAADNLSFVITETFGARTAVTVPAASSNGLSWTASWNAASSTNGAYAIVATATKGRVVTSSAALTATLANPEIPAMTVTLVSPASGVTVSGTTTLVASTSLAASSLAFILRDPARDMALVASVAATAGAGNTSWTATVNTATVPNGTYSLVARGFKDGTSVPSAAAAVTVANTVAEDTAEPLTVTVTLPTDGARLSGTVTLSATADRSIDGLSFTITNAAGSVSHPLTATGNDLRTVWRATWDSSSVPNGDYTLRTSAVKAGTETQGAPRSFSVLNVALAVTITSPSDSAEISGTSDVIVAAVPAATSVSVAIARSGSDEVASVRTASFDTARQVWTMRWNTADFPNGSYRLEARGTGAEGREFLSTSVTVRVANEAPAETRFGIRLVAPVSGATVSGPVPLAAAVTGEAAAVQFFASPSGGAVIRIDGRFDAARGLWVGVWRSGESANGEATLGAVAVNGQNVRIETERIRLFVSNAIAPDSPPAEPFSVRLLEPTGGVVTGRVRFVAETQGEATEVRVFVRLRGSGREPRALRATFDASRSAWVAEWDTTVDEVGSYDAVAVARNAQGAETTSPTIVTMFVERRAEEVPPEVAPAPVEETPATDGTRPALEIRRPVANATLRGSVVITAHATSVARVGFSARSSAGEAVMSRPGIRSGDAWSSLWDVSALAAGRYVIEAVAFDAAGARVASAQIGVAVSNAGERPVTAIDVVPAEVIRESIREVPSGTVALPVERLPRGVDVAASKLDAECLENRIPAARCAQWLASKHQASECRSAGIVTKEECVSLLKKIHGGEVPGCRGASEAACGEAVARKTAGLLGASELRDIKDAVTAHIGATIRVRAEKDEAGPAEDAPPSGDRQEAPQAVVDRFPFARDRAFAVRVHASPEYVESGHDASHQSMPAVLFLDSDDDGLPDDVEKRLGTDPAKADTDDDGYADGVEVRGGYNPRGKGRLSDGVVSLAPVDVAIISGTPIEQPKSAGVVDEDLEVSPPVVVTDDAGMPKSLRLAGHADPGDIITIFVYSYLPVVLTTTAQDDGTWSYELESGLSDGEHEVYATVTDETGKIKSKSNPLSFFVSEAKAVGEDEFFVPEEVSPLAAAALQEPVRKFGAIYLIGAIVLIGLALVISYLLFMRPKTPSVPPGAS